MKKPLRFSLLILLVMWVLQASAQVSVTAPGNNAVNVSALPTIFATTTSTTNQYETLYFELSVNPTFDPAQPSPNYFKSGLYIKNTVGTVTFTYRPPAVLAFNTRYYVRVFSSRYGFSPVVSFVTQANPTTITAPANGAVNVFLLPTIVATSTTTGNTAPNPAETIFFELSSDPNFNPNQTAPNYFRSGQYLKNFDGTVNFTYRPNVQLIPGTTYYARAFSSKFGYSPVSSFTTRGLLPPRIIYPTNGETNVSQTPTIQVYTNSVENTSPNPVESIYLEVSKDPSFNPTQPLPNYQRYGNFIRNYDTPDTYTYEIQGNRTLELGQTYYARAISNKNGTGPVVSFTVSASIVVDTTFLTSADGRFVTNGALVYANRYTYPLTARAASAANVYDWELDPDGDFVSTPAPFRATTASPNLVLQADAVDPATNYRLLSGQVYFVRVRGRRTVGTPLTGPWSGNNASDRRVYRYYNALHPATLASLYPNQVSFTEDDGGVKLFTQSIGNATAYIFQVDNDADFSSPYSLPPINPTYAARNQTYPGVAGTVFYANAIESGQPVFQNLGGLVNGTYFVRARALNANQSGYWHTVRSFTVNIPHEPISAINLTNNATEVPTNLSVQVQDDPDYLEASFDLQISADNFATTVLNLSNTPHRGNLPTGFFQVPGLQFNTTYQARVRTYVYNYPTNPTPWTVVTFKTQAAPRIVISAVPPSPWPTTGPSVYASNLPGVDQFDWQIEKTNAPVSSSSKTTTVSYVNFFGYVQAGGQYRIRVRGNATAQGITGVWSDWVSFSVAGTAAPRIAAAQSHGDDAPEAGAVTQVYPNPFAGTTRLYPGASSSEQTLVVTDVTGKVVEQRTLSGAQPVELGASWRSGVYVIRVVDQSGAVRTMRVLKR